MLDNFINTMWGLARMCPRSSWTCCGAHTTVWQCFGGWAPLFFSVLDNVVSTTGGICTECAHTACLVTTSTLPIFSGVESRFSGTQAVIVW